MIKSQLFIAAALIVGVAIGYFAGDHDTPSSSPVTTRQAPKSISDKGEDASVKALRKRVADLEAALAEKEAYAETTVSNAVAETEQRLKAERPFGNPREWMEKLRQDDPERYVQMTNRFAQWRRRQEARVRSSLDFLASVDTSHMSPEAKKTHASLQNLIAKREELAAALHQEDIGEEERNSLFAKMMNTNRELHRLNRAERRNLIEEAARNMGFEGDDVKEISSTIRAVIRATDDGWNQGHPPGGGPGDGRPDGR